MSESKSTTCRLCGASATYRFSKDLVADYVGRYYECDVCHLLQSTHLDGRSGEELSALYARAEALDLDPGAPWRQTCIVSRIAQIVRSRAIRRPARVLDYGGGGGFVGDALTLGLALRTWTYDPYAVPRSRQNPIIRRWEDVESNGQYDLVVASEVLEHLVDPKAELSRLGRVLSDEGWLYVTTGRYRPGLRNSDWSYLAPESGQHVCFYSAEAIRRVADLLNCEFVTQIGAEYEWLLGRKKPARPLARAAMSLIRTGVERRVLSKIE